MNSVDKINSPHKSFEDLKFFNDNKIECWSARDLFPLFGYSRWESFLEVIKRAMKSSFVSGQVVEDHFRQLTKMVLVGSNTSRKVIDYHLDRYACYLIAQNGDPKISEIALAQNYFIIQTRKQEIQNNSQVEKDKKRIFIREEVKNQNKKLFSTAKKSGVSNFGMFNDAGYLGLYGMNLADIEQKKKIKKGELLDRANSAELAANLFRITQTEERLSQDKILSQQRANQVHNMVGGKVRQTIKDIGGKLPENMESVIHIKEVKRNYKKIK
jgi:DNA-damage-inducible protein D